MQNDISESGGVSRRGFLTGVAAVGGAATLAALSGCGNSGGGQSSNGGSGAMAQSGPVTYKDDYLVDPKSEWEIVTTVEDSGLIEGMNWHDGELWFIDVATSRIFKVQDGKAVTVYQDEAKKAMPNGAKFIDGTTMLITDRALGLCTYDLKTNQYEVKVDQYDGKKFLGLNDLVLDGNGGAYFTDPGQSDYFTKTGNVYYVDYQNGYKVEKYVSNVAYPNGITISPDGLFLYVAEFNSNSLICVPSKSYKDAKDTPYLFARLVGGHGPDGVLTDKEGNVYCAHLNAKEVAVVDKSGWPVTTIRLPESATPLLSNLLINEGYLYVCEFGGKTIWRIKINAEPNPIA